MTIEQREEILDKITIGELKEIKKIAYMTVRDALPAARELRDKYGLTDRETLNLIGTAKNFKD